MIDIHCHILPDFDDGAADINESVGMARAAAASGVTGIVATPHFRGEPGSLNQISKLLSRYRALRSALTAAGLTLKLYLGAEILCLPETVQMAQAQQLPTLGDTNYVLCEFYFDTPPAQMNSLLSAIAACGYRIVVAHPERYHAIQRNPRTAERWFRQGYVLQLNKGSILGAFGPQVQRTAEILLENGFAHLIASDAHSTLFRTGDMSQIRAWVNTHCPPAYARVLLDENPQRLIRGENMVPPG